ILCAIAQKHPGHAWHAGPAGGRLVRPRRAANGHRAGVFGNQLGVAVGFVVPLFVSRGTVEDMGGQLLAMYIGGAAVTGLLLGLVVAMFKEGPPTPPTIARRLDAAVLLNGEQPPVAPASVRARRRRSAALPASPGSAAAGSSAAEAEAAAASLLHGVAEASGVESGFVLLTVSYGLNTGTYYALSTLLNPIIVPEMRKADVNATLTTDIEQQVGWAGFTMIAAGILGSVLAGIVLGKTKAFNMWLVFAAMFLLGLFMTGYLPVGFEFAAEITYPENEGLSSGILNASAQLMGIICTMVVRMVVDRVSSWPAISFFGLLASGRLCYDCRDQVGLAATASESGAAAAPSCRSLERRLDAQPAIVAELLTTWSKLARTLPARRLQRLALEPLRQAPAAGPLRLQVSSSSPRSRACGFCSCCCSCCFSCCCFCCSLNGACSTSMPSRVKPLFSSSLRPLPPAAPPSASPVVFGGEDGGSLGGPEEPDEPWDVLGPANVVQGRVGPEVVEPVSVEGRAVADEVLGVFVLEVAERAEFTPANTSEEAVPGKATVTCEGHMELSCTGADGKDFILEDAGESASVLGNFKAQVRVRQELALRHRSLWLEANASLDEPAGGFSSLATDKDVQRREAKKGVEAVKGSRERGIQDHAARTSLHLFEGFVAGFNLQGAGPDQAGVSNGRSDHCGIDPPEPLWGEAPGGADGSAQLRKNREGFFGFGLDVGGPAQPVVQRNAETL
uniref:MFS domain-containing protein n=1 Tax=Macrostomum lignano TaxID=282301 RepID=A0A1I8F3Q2_9PLAT